MTERLLQFIWQFQYFNKTPLTTEQGDALTIVHQGTYNVNQGPDFQNGRIKLGDTEWAGNIELHMRSSDWHRHDHGSDGNYDNVILHVVWQHDEDILLSNNSIIPTLVLEPLVPKLLLQKYYWLMLSQDFVPCQTQLPVLSELGWVAWKERLAIERLHRKAHHVVELLQQANNHWEEVFWWMLARNFGVRINSDAFETIAKTLPVTLLGRHKNQVNQLEALLLGQAALLSGDFDEDYPKMLQREYRFLRAKYKLIPIKNPPFFLRMRPANFPTVRLAQLAMLVNQSTHLFSKIKETESLDKLFELLNVTANDYWHYHYRFDEPVEYKPKQLGIQMIENIVINTVAPVLFAFGDHTRNQGYKDKALQWMSQVKAEVNNITKAWKSFGVDSKTAVESQGLIELKNSYCNVKRCLECPVGNGLLKNGG